MTMVVEKIEVDIPFNNFRGNSQEYSLWTHSPTHYFDNDCVLIRKGGEKATNPPKVISVWEEVITTQYFSEDGWFVIPTQHLAEGVSQGMQHRELIGISDGKI